MVQVVLICLLQDHWSFGRSLELFDFYFILFLFICFPIFVCLRAFCGCSYVCSSRTGRYVNAKRAIPPLLGGILLCIVLVALFISCSLYHGEAGLMTGGTVYVV